MLESKFNSKFRYHILCTVVNGWEIAALVPVIAALLPQATRTSAAIPNQA